MVRTLTETIDLMQSAEYEDRFAAEYYQLRIRCDKLEATIENVEEGFPQLESKCPLDLLRKQLQTMLDLLEILEDRAEIEGIDISDYS